MSAEARSGEVPVTASCSRSLRSPAVSRAGPGVDRGLIGRGQDEHDDYRDENCEQVDVRHRSRPLRA
jgi:hypothetical protein